MKIGNIEVYGIIYKITNKVNGKVYIGQTVKGFNKRYGYNGIGIERVYKHHKRRKENCNQHLLRSIEKYGVDAFEIMEVFDIAFSKQELLLKEKCWIAIYKSYNSEFGYNKTLGGEGTYGYSFWHEKDESELKILREKKSETMSGKNHHFYGKNPRDYWSENSKENWSKIMTERMNGENNPMYGKNPRDYMTEEAKIEHDKKISEASSGENNPMYGKQHSEETKRKIGEANKSRIVSDETKRKLSEINKGENNPMYGVHRYGKSNPHAKSVICLTTKRIFFTAKEGAEYYNCNYSSIVMCCKGFKKQKGRIVKVNYAGKLKDGTPLVWKYLIWKHGKSYKIKRDNNE